MNTDRFSGSDEVDLLPEEVEAAINAAMDWKGTEDLTNEEEDRVIKFVLDAYNAEFVTEDLAYIAFAALDAPEWSLAEVYESFHRAKRDPEGIDWLLPSWDWTEQGERARAGSVEPRGASSQQIAELKAQVQSIFDAEGKGRKWEDEEAMDDAEVRAMRRAEPNSPYPPKSILDPVSVPTTITARELRQKLFEIENQAMTVEELRLKLFRVQDQDEPVRIDSNIWFKFGIQ